MDEPVGLRERKRRRTHSAISEAAIALFLERGYDDVSIADVAAAAEVSRRTLFAYFPTKDELVMHRFADHEDEAARVVAGRAPGEDVLDALHRHLRDGLERRDPITGLCDIPQVVAFYRLVVDTPALGAARVRYLDRGEAALAAALYDALSAGGPEGDPQAGPGVATGEPDLLVARLAAAQIMAVQGVLATGNQERIAAGATAEALAPAALLAADRAFAMLRRGLAPVLVG